MEAADLVTALGGPDLVTPQRRALIEDTARLGLALRALLAAFVQGGATDGELASRLSSLAGARRANLALLGLGRMARDVPSLEQYLARAAQDGAQRTIASAPDAEAEPADNGAQDSNHVEDDRHGNR